jgi:hypothetical protein
MSSSPKRPVTADEMIALAAIARVGMSCGSWDKRFARDTLSTARETGMIGEKSAPQLWRLFIRYRRQIGCPRKAELLKIAERLAAPDFRKQRAAANEQAKIDALKSKYQQAMQPESVSATPA